MVSSENSCWGGGSDRGLIGREKNNGLGIGPSREWKTGVPWVYGYTARIDMSHDEHAYETCLQRFASYNIFIVSLQIIVGLAKQKVYTVNQQLDQWFHVSMARRIPLCTSNSL